MLIKKVRTHSNKHFPRQPPHIRTLNFPTEIWYSFSVSANQLVGNDLNSLKKIRQAADKSMIEW